MDSFAKFSFFVVLSLLLHILCLSFNLMSTAEPFKSKQVGVNYVSRSLDSFYPTPEPKASAGSMMKSPSQTMQKTIAVGSDQARLKKQRFEETIPAVPQVTKTRIKQKKVLSEPKIIADIEDVSTENPTVELELIKSDTVAVDLEEVETPQFTEEDSVQTAIDLPEIVNTKPQGVGTLSSLVGGIEHAVQPDTNQRQIAAVKGKTSSHISQGFKDALPRYDVNPPPRYPEVAKLRGWEGKVVFEALILKSGRVGHLDVVASSGYRSLDNAARKAISRWKFSPATSFGLSIDSQVEIPVTFSLTDP